MSKSEANTASTDRRRCWLLIAGVLLTVLSAVCLVEYALTHGAELRATRFGSDWAAWAGAALLFCIGALVATALGWVAALRACRDSIPAGQAIGISLVSQIGKYVPGSVTHHVGKAVFATGRGMSLKIVAKSTVLELASAIGAGIVVALASSLASPLLQRLLLNAAARVPGWVVAVAVTASLGLFALVLIRRSGQLRDLLTVAPRPLLALAALHLASVILAGLSFHAVVEALGDGRTGLTFDVALFSIAWLVGFLTPGSPAGLGVREAVIVAGMSSTLGPAALAAAITHRLISALGDGIMAAFGLVLLRSSATRDADV